MQVYGVDRVLGVPRQRRDYLALVVVDLEVVADEDAALVEEGVVLGQRHRMFSVTSGPKCGLPRPRMWAPSETEPPGMSSRTSQTWHVSPYIFLTAQETLVSRTMRVVTPVGDLGDRAGVEGVDVNRPRFSAGLEATGEWFSASTEEVPERAA